MDLNKLLRTTIGGPDRFTAQELHAEEAEEALPFLLYPGNKSPFRVEIPSNVLGSIIYLGPTYKDIISMPEKTFEWDKAVELCACSDHPTTKREQSDLFLQELERADEYDLTRLS